MTRAAKVLLLSSLISTPTSAQVDRQQTPSPPGILVAVGGHRLHLHCSGRGSPTVVLESGAGDFSFDWSLVRPALARLTRVCSYDRAGYAWSEPGPTPRTIRQIVAELHVLLTAARIAPPYVLVGHSLGGLIVRTYAVQHRTQVRGLVLIEATHEDNPMMLNGQLVLLRSLSRGREIPPARFDAPATDSSAASGGPQAPQSPTLEAPYDRLPPDIQRVRLWAMQQPGYAARGSEFDYLAEELSQMHEQRTRDSVPLGDIPLVVLTRKDAPPDHAGLQADLVRLSRDGKQIIAATDDHHIQLGDPRAVINAVSDLVRAVRARARVR